MELTCQLHCACFGTGYNAMFDANDPFVPPVTVWPVSTVAEVQVGELQLSPAHPPSQWHVDVLESQRPLPEQNLRDHTIEGQTR